MKRIQTTVKESAKRPDENENENERKPHNRAHFIFCVFVCAGFEKPLHDSSVPVGRGVDERSKPVLTDRRLERMSEL
jgi:hypothetical protein